MRNPLIQSSPTVMMGKPVVSGTRVTVELILEKLAAGETVDHLIAAHPRLTQEGVRAALDFAAQALRADVVYPDKQIVDWLRRLGHSVDYVAEMTPSASDAMIRC